METEKKVNPKIVWDKFFLDLKTPLRYHLFTNSSKFEKKQAMKTTFLHSLNASANPLEMLYPFYKLYRLTIQRNQLGLYT